MSAIGTRFRRLIEAALAVRPFQTDHGVVAAETREFDSGYPGGSHEPARCWIYRPHGLGLEMLFGFYSNFTPDDLITKVIPANAEIKKGIGATVQFNADRSVTPDGEHFALHHHGLITVHHAMSREALVNCIREQAPDADRMLGGLDVVQGWPLRLGSTDRLNDLIDRLFLYCFAVEQAKRSWRGEALLPPLQTEPTEPLIEPPPTDDVGPRWNRLAAARSAIEQAAMSRALQHYRQHWPVVEDVSASRPYDIYCTGNGQELRVEVKGTTLDGTAVQLTPNEVAHARTHRPRVALFIVHDLALEQDTETGQFSAHGGTVTIHEPWDIDDCELVPTGYSCLLPRARPAPA